MRVVYRCARLRREPRARRVGARPACAIFESRALRAWLLVSACGCSSSSRWQPRARPVLPPLGRSSLRRGLLAARWLLRPPRSELAVASRAVPMVGSELELQRRAAWPEHTSVSDHVARSFACARPPGPWWCVCCVCEGVVSLGLAVSCPLVSSLSDVTTSHRYYWSSGLVRLWASSVGGGGR